MFGHDTIETLKARFATGRRKILIGNTLEEVRVLLRVAELAESLVKDVEPSSLANQILSLTKGLRDASKPEKVVKPVKPVVVK